MCGDYERDPMFFVDPLYVLQDSRTGLWIKTGRWFIKEQDLWFAH
jgi:hypothetical protein